MKIDIEPSWRDTLGSYFERQEWQDLADFVRSEYLNKTVYPRPKDIFNAFRLCPFEEVKVVILGQDPYHNPGQAHGLSFSVREDITPPPSLKNIYKEIASDLGITKDVRIGDLSPWAHQGVLLLNAVLSVEKNKPTSHAQKGWEKFTDYVIQTISHKKEHCVFILWGNYAKKKASLIDGSKHLILTSAHPSPLSAHGGFFGSRPFSQTNSYLKKYKKKEIRW